MAKDFCINLSTVIRHFEAQSGIRQSSFNDTCLQLLNALAREGTPMRAYQKKMLNLTTGKIKAREVLKYVRKKRPIKGKGDDNTAFLYAEYAAKAYPRLRNMFMPIKFDRVSIII